MKVLHVVNDASTGGAQTLIEQLALEQKSGIEVHILVLLAPGPLSPRFFECASSVTYLSMDRRSIRLDTLVRSTRRVIREVAPDIVHSHLLQADLAVSFATVGLAVSTVSTVHTTGMSTADPLRSRVLGRLLGLLSARCIDVSVACGQGAADYMLRNRYAMTTARTINNGVTISDDNSQRFPQKRRSLLSLSRWHPMKDHKNLFEAFRLVREQGLVRDLICAGTGMTEDNEELVAMLESLGIRSDVTLLGPVTNVRSLLRTSDVLVISSAYGEALPMAGIEALAEGTPVVTTDLGDCDKLVVDEKQRVPPGDERALAGALAFILNLNPDAYCKFSQESKSIARRLFSIEATSTAYKRLYIELTGAVRGVKNAR